VTEPLDNYARLFGQGGYLTTHEQNKYHHDAVVYADNFRQNMKSNTNIIQEVDAGVKRTAEQNRNRLRPIVKSILFCGENNVSLRGHRDDGALLEHVADDVSIVQKQDGIFRRLLMFRIDAGDDALEQHLKTAASNATYISKTIQHDIIKATGNVIRDKILHRLQTAQFFTLMADETTDISKKEQMSLCVRYIDEGIVREDFLDFVHVTDLRGVGLANSILEQLKKRSINLDYMVGQAYDGAAAMSGRLNGVQAIIQQDCKNAIYVHCASHCLNLALSKSCTVPSIRNAQGTIASVAAFCNGSQRRVQMLKASINSVGLNTKKEKLKNLCETRWIERHDAVLCFIELYEATLDFLDKCTNLDSETASKARMFQNTIETTEFLVSLSILGQVLSITLPLAKSLQKVQLDLYEATGYIANTISCIQDKRDQADESFKQPWSTAEDLMKKAGLGDMSMPRVARFQRHRSNIPATTPHEYYLKNHYVVFLDHILSQLRDRFDAHNNAVFCMSALIPSLCHKYDSSHLVEACDKYHSFLESKQAVQSEFDVWQHKWKVIEPSERPNNALEGLYKCSRDFFPNINTLLQIFATLPVTTSTPERTFSRLRLLKTYLRNTMGNERLTGLAHMFIHGDIQFTPDEVIDKFAAQKNRRLDFVL
jgi:hypothetical protein